MSWRRETNPCPRRSSSSSSTTAVYIVVPSHCYREEATRCHNYGSATLLAVCFYSFLFVFPSFPLGLCGVKSRGGGKVSPGCRCQTGLVVMAASRSPWRWPLGSYTRYKYGIDRKARVDGEYGGAAAAAPTWHPLAGGGYIEVLVVPYFFATGHRS